MGSEVQLISDGDGLAVIGDPTAVEAFLRSEGLPSTALGLPRLSQALTIGSGSANVASTIAASSGRWVKLTKESAQHAKKFGLMKSSKTGLSMGVVQAKGQAKGIKGIVQFAKGPGAKLSNPALLAGAAGLMAQLAMQQAMDEITDYLATIDEKVDDILRAQKDAVIADMIGVGLALEEAMAIRGEVGRVSEVTWSKVQTTSMVIARTQAYALRQLDALAEKLEHKAKSADLAKASKEAETKVREWLAVLARCVQLQDAFTVLELDRVLDASPEELDRHRLALRNTRQKRLELIAQTTSGLMARLDATAGTANTKVLLHPIASRSTVESSNEVADGVVAFQRVLGIEADRQVLSARRWTDATTEARDAVVAKGAEGVDAALRFGGETADRVKSATDTISSKVSERVTRRHEGGS